MGRHNHGAGRKGAGVTYVLVVALLVFGADGKLRAAQDSYAHDSMRSCQDSAVAVTNEVKRHNAGATVVTQCVAVVRPVGA